MAGWIARVRSDAVDRAVRELFRGARGSALLAVGGYGRRQMSPGSDIDLLLVHDGHDPMGAAGDFEELLYPLWDAHLAVGHAIRTIDECRAEATPDVGSLTALLTARRLRGSERLTGDVRAIASAMVGRDPTAFLEALDEWRMRRRLRFGSVGDALEPDVKEAVGGLRDLQLLEWIEAAVPKDARAVLLDPVERRWVRDGRRSVLIVREAMQRESGERANRLVADSQGAVAAALGYVAAERGNGGAWAPEDLLLRDLLLGGRRVAMATSGAMDRARALIGGAMPVTSAAIGERAGPLSAAARAIEEGRDPSHASLARTRAIRRSRWPAPERDALVEVLASGDRGSEWLLLIDAMDVLPAMVPGWGDVRGRPQRDPFHSHPVDVHLLRAAAEMARILRRPDDPFAANATAVVDNVAAPLLGALLHDMGKIGRASHVPIGVSVAGSVLTRLGTRSDVADDVLFLVREHLLLADTATRRNLSDEDLIVRVAATVGDGRRLAMLYLLTLADAAATGPHAQTPWRLGLVKELVAKVDAVFERGLIDRRQATAVQDAEGAMRQVLGDQNGTLVDRFLADVPTSYLTTVHPEDARDHMELVVPAPSGEDVRMRHRPGDVEGTHVVVVATADRPGLLAALTAAFALSRLSILSARAFTTASGAALDEFVVRGAAGDELADTWDRLREDLSDAARGSGRTADRVQAARAQYRPSRRRSPIEVRVDVDGSQPSTVVEVETTDRLGLLSDLARAFADLGLDVNSARVATYGPRVVDVFYVTTADGEPLSDPRAIEALREALSSAANG